MTRLARIAWLGWAACCLPAGCARPYAPPSDATLTPEACPVMRAGQDAAQRGDWPAAVAQFDQAMRLSPSSHLPLYGLATAYDGMGGRDAIALAYYRAYLVSLPAGRVEDTAPLLGRADEIDRQLADRVAQLQRQARRMLDAMPPELWWDTEHDRAKLVGTLDGIAGTLAAAPAPRPDPHRPHRGQPSKLARLEAQGWIDLAERFRASPMLSQPGKALREQGSAMPEKAVATACQLAARQAEALWQLRDLERQWQAKWDMVSQN